jgi:hypothetical protein
MEAKSQVVSDGVDSEMILGAGVGEEGGWEEGKRVVGVQSERRGRDRGRESGREGG